MSTDEKERAERMLENPCQQTGTPQQVAADKSRADSTVFGNRSVVADHNPGPQERAVRRGRRERD
jgi:hypothetical protein